MSSQGGRKKFRFKNKPMSLDGSVIDPSVSRFDCAKFRQTRMKERRFSCYTSFHGRTSQPLGKRAVFLLLGCCELLRYVYSRQSSAGFYSGAVNSGLLETGAVWLIRYLSQWWTF